MRGIRIMNEDIKILIAEDDEDINDLLRDMLRDNGYEVSCAYSGTEALIYLNHEKIDLVLLDLMLPGKTGEEVLEEIKNKYEIPVIIISAKEESGIKPRLLRAGAEDFITKPFDLDEVLARIEVNIRRKNNRGSNKLSIDDNLYKYKEITLNSNTREAFVNDRLLTLTLREFEILTLLIKYPNKVFSKDNIFKSVWGAEFISDDNTITVHISNLRSKISKAQAKEDYIKTIWGIGYKLEV